MIFDTLLRESLDFEMMENKNELTAPIVDYDRIRIQCDGDGVRTIVFFYGCPLRCKYCHNPDTWAMTGGKIMEASDIIAQYERNLPFYKGGGITVTGGEPMLQIDFLIEPFNQLFLFHQVSCYWVTNIR